MPRLVAGVVGILVVLGVATWLAFGHHFGGNHLSARHKKQSTASMAKWTLIATVNNPTPGYARIDSTTPETTVPSAWAGAPSTLPVIASKSGWVKVRLVARPPSPQTAWISSASVSLSRTPFHLLVDRSLRRLLLFRQGRLVMCAPAGVGVPQDPTPLGHYFVAFLARAPKPAYGPFVIVTSAFADTVTDWEQSGNAMITIEGPLGSAKAIGRTGAAVTAGSVRLLDATLEQLREVPPGTPLDVVNALQISSVHESGMCHIRLLRRVKLRVTWHRARFPEKSLSRPSEPELLRVVVCRRAGRGQARCCRGCGPRGKLRAHEQARRLIGEPFTLPGRDRSGQPTATTSRVSADGPVGTKSRLRIRIVHNTALTKAITAPMIKMSLKPFTKLARAA